MTVIGNAHSGRHDVLESAAGAVRGAAAVFPSQLAGVVSLAALIGCLLAIPTFQPAQASSSRAVGTAVANSLRDSHALRHLAVSRERPGVAHPATARR
jgi:hypothetical protein